MARRRTDQTRQEFFDSRTSSHDDGQTKRNSYVARIRATTNRPKIIRVFHDWCDFFREGRIYGIFSFPNRRRQISRSSNLAIVKSRLLYRQISQSRSLGIEEFRNRYFTWIRNLVMPGILILESFDPKTKTHPRCL